jgi:hypothetical protein
MNGKKYCYEDFKLTREREQDLRRNGPAILDSLVLTDKFFSILRTDSTLTREMEEDVKVKYSFLTNRHTASACASDSLAAQGVSIFKFPFYFFLF